MCLQGIVTIKDIRTPSPAEDTGKKPSMNWYLRKKDGEIYGPVDLETLQLWATDSRIAPEDEASTDREHWSPASGIPELGMDWVVELRDGTLFGPTHLLAVKDLVQDGSVSRRGKITNVRAKETAVVSEVLVAALIGLASKMQGTIDTLQQRLGPSVGEAPGDERIEALQAEIRRLTEQKDRLEEDAAKWKGLYEESAGNAVARENELKARFSTGRSTEARLDGLKAEVEESKQLANTERAAARKKEDELKEQIRKLKADAQQTQELAQQVEKWKSLYEHLKASAGDKTRAMGRPAAAGDNDMVPRVRLEEVERKLSQVQKSYQNLLRSANRNMAPGGRSTPPAADNLRRWQVS